MNYVDFVREFALNTGSRSTAKLLTAGVQGGFKGSGMHTGRKSDPRALCVPKAVFSGGIGSRSSRGYRYQQTAGSQFDFGELVRDVAVNSVIGGFASAAFYGFDKAVGAVSEGIRGRRSSQQKMDETQAIPGTSKLIGAGEGERSKIL